MVSLPVVHSCDMLKIKGAAVRNTVNYLRETLGEHIFQRFIEAKTIEWNEYRIHVSDWELKRYLPIY